MNLPITEHLQLAVEEYWIKIRSGTATVFDLAMFRLLEISVPDFINHWYDKEATRIKQ